MNKKQTIPQLILFMVVLLLVVLLFLAWHDQGISLGPGARQMEVFVVINQSGVLKTELHEASYPLLVLRPAGFRIPEDWADYQVLRYATEKNMEAARADLGTRDAGLSMVVMSGSSGRRAIHRFAALDLKFPFTLVVMLLSILILQCWIKRPLHRA